MRKKGELLGLGFKTAVILLRDRHKIADRATFESGELTTEGADPLDVAAATRRINSAEKREMAIKTLIQRKYYA